MRFACNVFLVYPVTVQLITDRGFAATNSASDFADAVPFVVQDLDFVTFVFGEMDIVLSWSHNKQTL